MKLKDLGSEVDKILTEEVRKYIKENIGKEKVFHVKADGEPIETCYTKEEAENTLNRCKKDPNLKGKQIILEPSEYDSYDDMIDKLDEMGENLDMKNKELKESKRTIMISEEQAKLIVKSIISETVPGIEVTKKAQNQSKKDAAAHLKDVETKMNKAAKFDGNDKPEFPNAIGKGEKVAIYNTEEEEEYVEDYRGGGMQDIKYDEDPGELFKKRQKMSLEGDKLTGNSQDAANVVKSDLGKKMVKRALRKAEKTEKDPMYIKDKQPVMNKENSSDKESWKERNALSEDIDKMKKIYSYDKRTQ